jgi:class 3 adenylate cyclase
MSRVADDPNQPDLQALGETGILFADLSGYSQLVYQCVGDEEKLKRLGLALFRLFNDASADHPDVTVEGYAGDGFLALAHGKKPAKAIYDFATTVHERFEQDVKSLLLNLGFRVSVSLRTGMHVGKVWQMPMRPRNLAREEEGVQEIAPPMGINLSDAIVVASRVVTGQTCRRFGVGVTRTCYKRLMLAGGKTIREPDEVIQDRNQYPEPVEVYRLTDEEHAKIRSR